MRAGFGGLGTEGVDDAGRLGTAPTAWIKAARMKSDRLMPFTLAALSMACANSEGTRKFNIVLDMAGRVVGL